MPTKTKAWSPAPRVGTSRGMLTNGPRIQMGFLPALVVAGVDLAPWIFWTVVGSGAAVGVSALARSEADKWKESLGINLSNLPVAILAGGAGAMGIAVGGSLEGVSKAVATGVGIAGLTASLYLLFSGHPTPPSGAAAPGAAPKEPLSVPPATVPANQQAPAMAPGPAARAFTLSFPPSQPNTGGTTRQMWSDQDWEYVLRNETGSQVSFYTGVAIYDEGNQLIWKSPAIDPVYGRKLVTVGAGQALNTIQKSQGLGFLIPKSVAVEIQLFRNRDDANPYLTSEAIPIKMSFIG
jgi:hypothetical protein